MESIPIAASQLQGPASTSTVPRDPSYWWSLADPVRKVAGYLFLRDRMMLGQASRAFHAILCNAADTTMERARLIFTMSRFQQVLARVWRMPGDSTGQSAVLCVVGARIPRIPPQHRLKAWRAMLDASACLAPEQRGAVLAALVRPARALPETGDRFRELDERAMVLAPPDHARVTLATLSVLGLAPDEFAGGPSLRVWPFSLGDALAHAARLAPGERRAAVDEVVAFHARRASDADAAWREAIGVIRELGDPQLQAWALMAMTAVSDARQQPLLRRLPVPSNAVEQVLAHARMLPVEMALDVLVALPIPPQAVRSADASAMAGAMRRLWAFSRDCRFDRDQQSRLAAAMLDWLSHEQRVQAWHETLERCQREGMTDLRAVCLAELLAGVLRNLEAVDRHDFWDTVRAACDTSSTTPAVAAHLRLLLARQLTRLQFPYRALAAQNLLTGIDRMRPSPLECDAIDHVLRHLPADTAAVLCQPMFEAVPAGMQASWMTGGALLTIVQSPQFTARLLAAFAAEPAGQRDGDKLAKAVEHITAAAMPGVPNHSEIIQVLLAGLPAAVAGIDLGRAPQLACAMAHFALLVQADGEASADPAHARRCRDYVAQWHAAVLTLPVERRQALLEALLLDNANMLARTSGMAKYRAAFTLDVVGSMPAAYRVPVLLALIRAWPYECRAWSDQRPVWQAIRALPAQDQACLLLACASWFEASALDHDAPEIREQRTAARAEWLDAITGLPEIDALALVPR